MKLKVNRNNKDNIRISPWRERMHEIIFESDTLAGKLFDICLLIAIVLSVLIIMLETVDTISIRYGHVLKLLEWVFTAVFTLEFIARIVSLRRPRFYLTSFLGIIDLISILPTYLSIFFAGTHVLLVIRILRLVRVFRILKLTRYVGEANELASALRASSHKIIVFIVIVISLVTIMGTLMYLIEPKESGFTSIPMSIYWAIVTLTTVGYGDITPTTVPGQLLASIIMILGYGIIAVPTGIVTAEMANIKMNQKVNNSACRHCGRKGHDSNADYCKYCGSKLNV